MLFKNFHLKKSFNFHKCIYAYVKVFGLVLILAGVGVSFLLLGKKSFARESSVVIENNVSATANTGGNVTEGSGEIQTGSASAKAESSVRTNTSGEGKTKIDAKAEATANGKTETKEIHRETEGSVKEEVKVEAESEGGGSEAAASSEVAADDKDIAEENSKENENIFLKITKSISKRIKNILKGVVSIFS